MAGANIFWRFASDAGTITTSSATSEAPITNLQDNILANIWQSDGTDLADVITVDMGSAVEVGAFAFLDHDIIASDVLLLEFASDSGFTTDTGTVSVTFNANTLLEYFTPVTRQYWRLTITKLATPARQAGRLLLGEFFALAHSTREPGASWGLSKSTGSKVTTDGGQIYGNLGAQLLMMSGTIGALTDLEYDEIEALKEAYGEVVPFIFSAAPVNDLYGRSIYGVFSKLPQFQSYKPDLWTLNLSMQEQK